MHFEKVLIKSIASLSIASSFSVTASAVVLTDPDAFVLSTTSSQSYRIGVPLSAPSLWAFFLWDFEAIDNDTFRQPAPGGTAGDVFQFHEASLGSIASRSNRPAGAVVGANFGPFEPSFDIPDGGSSYLAFERGSDLDPEFREYGWVHLQNNGGTVTLLESAAAINEPGIIVGTLTVIPEPSSALLLIATPFRFLTRRR